MASRDKQIYSEDELVIKRQNDDYLVKKVVKFTVLGLFVLVLVFFAVSLCIEYIKNPETKALINDVILQNFSAIILAGLYILGINVLKKRD